MLPIPENVAAQFNEVLQQRAIREPFRASYIKWLRYFLDFCRKYQPPEAKSEQVRLFIAKLRSKKQTPQQCTQAAHAISLFLESQQAKDFPHPEPVMAKPPPPARQAPQQLKSPNPSGAAFNFEEDILTVHDKGDKGRTVPLRTHKAAPLKSSVEN